MPLSFSYVILGIRKAKAQHTSFSGNHHDMCMNLENLKMPTANQKTFLQNITYINSQCFCKQQFARATLIQRSKNTKKWAREAEWKPLL